MKYFSLSLLVSPRRKRPSASFFFIRTIKRILIFVQQMGLSLGVPETLLFGESSFSVAGGQPRSLPRIHCPWQLLTVYKYHLNFTLQYVNNKYGIYVYALLWEMRTSLIAPVVAQAYSVT